MGGDIHPPRTIAAVCLLTLLVTGVPPLHAQTDGGRGVQQSGPERRGGRVALVVGNASYASISPLQNPANDAEDVAAALERLGFTTIKRINQSREELFEAVRSFAQEAAGADVALLFYAGHGVEVGGENYLLPVDLDGFGGDDGRIDDEALPLGQILLAMKQASMQLLVLDACRNNPLPDHLAGGQSGGGWAIPSPDAMGGTLVAYGTAPGAVASDNVEGRNGLFTQALLAEMEVPGIEAAEMMRRVTRRVREASDERQSPWLSSSYVLPFYFIEPDGRRDHERLASAAVSDVEAWARDGVAAYRREEYEAALPLLRQAARAGHTESQYYLGTMYLGGRAVPEDPAEAADWFELASMQGHPQAQYFLGGMYGGGFGRRRDDARAADLYERAAEQGLSVGQFRLGIVYESGRGRPRDLNQALRWYLQAAKQGHEEARNALERLANDGHENARAMQRLLGS